MLVNAVRSLTATSGSGSNESIEDTYAGAGVDIGSLHRLRQFFFRHENNYMLVSYNLYPEMNAF